MANFWKMALNLNALDAWEVDFSQVFFVCLIAWIVWAVFIRLGALPDLPEHDWSGWNGSPDLPEEDWLSCLDKSGNQANNQQIVKSLG